MTDKELDRLLSDNNKFKSNNQNLKRRLNESANKIQKEQEMFDGEYYMLEEKLKAALHQNAKLKKANRKLKEELAKYIK